MAGEKAAAAEDFHKWVTTEQKDFTESQSAEWEPERPGMVNAKMPVEATQPPCPP
jgi:hypothetical protein